MTGHFIAATCNECNLQLKLRKGRGNKFFVPVICHNMREYDGHLIIKHLQKKDVEGRQVNVIATNSEKFLAFQIGQLRFIDSLQFMNSFLSALVDIIAKEDDGKLQHTRRHFESENLFNLVRCKGVFPYEYMDSPQKFDETNLPPIEAFYSKLTDENISEDDYAHAHEVWREFDIKNMREYHDLYLKTDVLLLADVFENFRSVSLENYGLDPCHYYTAPGLSLSACLKKTKVQLELFTDPDQLLFVEKGIRGGISTIMNRYSRANNKYLPDFKPEEPSKYILYLDANNLYGYAMSESLPTGEFKFLTERQIDKLNFDNVQDNDDYSYILEVDLDYPEHLHELHNDYPLAPESISVEEEMLSPYCVKLLATLGKKAAPKTKKLIPNLRDKSK